MDGVGRGDLPVIPFVESLIEPSLRRIPRIDKLLTTRGAAIKRDLKVVALICLFIGSYRAWVFEHRNAESAMYGKDGKSEVWGKYNSCDKDRAVKSMLTDVYSGQIAEQRSRLDDEQAIFNKCILALGISNVPPPATIKLYVTPTTVPIKKPSGEVSTLSVLTIVTSKSIAPWRTTVSCENNFRVLHSEVAGITTFIGFETEAISDHQYRLGSVSPAWRADTPILMVIASPEPPKGCAVKLN